MDSEKAALNEEKSPAASQAITGDACAPVLTAADLYKSMEAELFKRELSNSENYDKSLLAYASGGLGLSLTFIKDVVPLSDAAWVLCLELSWVAWILTILVVLGSFLLSQKAITRQLDLARRYYLENEDDAFNEKNVYSTVTGWANLASGVLFLFGVGLTTVFVWINLPTKTTSPPAAETVPMKKPTTTTPGHAMDGAPVPTIQKVAPVSPAPKPSSPSPAPAPAPAPPKQ